MEVQLQHFPASFLNCALLRPSHLHRPQQLRVPLAQKALLDINSQSVLRVRPVHVSQPHSTARVFIRILNQLHHPVYEQPVGWIQRLHRYLAGHCRRRDRLCDGALLKGDQRDRLGYRSARPGESAETGQTRAAGGDGVHGRNRH